MSLRIAVVVAISLSLQSDAGECIFEANVSTLEADTPTTTIGIKYKDELRLFDLETWSAFNLSTLGPDLFEAGVKADLRRFAVGAVLGYDFAAARPRFQLDASWSPVSWLTTSASMLLVHGEAAPRFEVGIALVFPVGR